MMFITHCPPTYLPELYISYKEHKPMGGLRGLEILLLTTSAGTDLHSQAAASACMTSRLHALGLDMSSLHS